MHLSKWCGARTRRGSRCRSPAMPNGRCRMHGGLSPGAPKGNRNAFKHGRYAAEAIARRREIAELGREIAELVSAMKPLNTGRTFAFAFHNPTSKGVARSSRFSAARWRGRYGARAAAGDAGGRISQPPGARVGISWMRSAGVLPKPGTSRARTSRSNIAWRAIDSIGSRNWRPIWDADESKQHHQYVVHARGGGADCSWHGAANPNLQRQHQSRRHQLLLGPARPL
jgi:hypothetical protein